MIPVRTHKRKSHLRSWLGVSLPKVDTLLRDAKSPATTLGSLMRAMPKRVLKGRRDKLKVISRPIFISMKGFTTTNPGITSKGGRIRRRMRPRLCPKMGQTATVTLGLLPFRHFAMSRGKVHRLLTPHC